jgi:hypothetical protein
MEVQSRRDTSAQRALGLIMFFYLPQFCTTSSSSPNVLGKALDPIWDSIARTTNPMEWNEMMCFGSLILSQTSFCHHHREVLLFSLECTQRKFLVHLKCCYSLVWNALKENS